MTKEELKQEARKDIDSLNGIDLVSSTMIAIDKYGAYKLGRYDGYLASAESREKRIEELEGKISILLSCKNCPENKGGYICEKEYDGKCLSQKTQYIKELQAENDELRSKIESLLAYKTLYRHNTCKKRYFVSTNPSAESSPAMPCYTDRNCAECPMYSAAESQ